MRKGGPSSKRDLVLSLNQSCFFGHLLGYNRLGSKLKKKKENNMILKKKKTYRCAFTLIILLSWSIDPISLVEFALGSLGPLCPVSFQQFLTAGCLFLFVAWKCSTRERKKKEPKNSRFATIFSEGCRSRWERLDQFSRKSD